MRKSGLHKQISSIFDGVPVPQNNALSEESAMPAEQPESTDAVNKPQEAAPAPNAARSSLVQRLSAEPSQYDVQPAAPTEPDAQTEPRPVVQVGRPIPLPKTKAMCKADTPSNLSNVSAQIKKALFGSQGASIDPRQKKAAVLVGVLSVVFAAVMFISLGGVGKTEASPSNDSDANSASQGPVAKKTARDWERPAPLPEDLRDATAPVQVRSTPQADNAIPSSGGLVVKGILFSKNQPSAIINNEIVSEGEVFNGVKVVRITKDTVEFEANQKRWTQQVQR